ncbi:hypothetical protein VSR34_28435 [Paraburkholderia sp. JHI2823]|uniref:hypothetical protein n=1 Tax=Paraburkholderia TaxID=1822464 RepID=UPI00041A28AC|nr:hypothetical protein [Paraburkholderia mimosarum]
MPSANESSAPEWHDGFARHSRSDWTPSAFSFSGADRYSDYPIQDEDRTAHRSWLPFYAIGGVVSVVFLIAAYMISHHGEREPTAGAQVVEGSVFVPKSTSAAPATKPHALPSVPPVTAELAPPPVASIAQAPLASASAPTPTPTPAPAIASAAPPALAKAPPPPVASAPPPVVAQVAPPAPVQAPPQRAPSAPPPVVAQVAPPAPVQAPPQRAPSAPPPVVAQVEPPAPVQAPPQRAPSAPPPVIAQVAPPAPVQAPPPRTAQVPQPPRHALESRTVTAHTDTRPQSVAEQKSSARERTLASSKANAVKASAVQHADVSRSLASARANLDKNNLGPARSALSSVLTQQPGNGYALHMQSELTSREDHRDSLLGYARLCAREGNWVCAWHNAGNALTVDASSSEARELLSRSIAAQGAGSARQVSAGPPGPPIDPN